MIGRPCVAAYASHYGEVASVAYTKNIGTLLSAERDLAKARVRLHELRAWRAAAEDAGEGGGVAPSDRRCMRA